MKIVQVYVIQEEINDVIKGVNLWIQVDFNVKVFGMDWNVFFDVVVLGKQ